MQTSIMSSVDVHLILMDVRHVICICGPMSVPTLTPIMTALDAQHFVMEFHDHTHRLLSGVASSISWHHEYLKRLPVSPATSVHTYWHPSVCACLLDVHREVHEQLYGIRRRLSVSIRQSTILVPNAHLGIRERPPDFLKIPKTNLILQSSKPDWSSVQAATFDHMRVDENIWHIFIAKFMW